MDASLAQDDFVAPAQVDLKTVVWQLNLENVIAQSQSAPNVLRLLPLPHTPITPDLSQNQVHQNGYAYQTAQCSY